MTNASFDEFVNFLFEREEAEDQTFEALCARGEKHKWKPWYFETKVLFDSRTICSHYQSLFRDARFLLNRFSKAQLDQGFWAIQSGNLDCSVLQLIWDKTLPFAVREELVRSMYALFRELFFAEPLDGAVYMWWDSLCYDWHCGNRKRDKGGDDMAMQNVMFETLSQILAIPSEICQGAALHGLSHLHHPETEALIQRYLDQNPSVMEERKVMALAASRFDLE